MRKNVHDPSDREGAKVEKNRKRKKTRFSDVFDTGYLRNVFIGAVGSVVLLGLVYYVCWHVTGGFEGSVEVTAALRSSAEERFDTVGYMFRDETVLYSEYGGAMDVLHPEGERVAAGDMLLTAYKNPDSAQVTEKLKELDRRIAVLEASAVGNSVSVSYTKALENSINVALAALRGELADNSYLQAAARSEELLVLLNRKELIFSSKEDYSVALAALKSERAALADSLTGERSRIYAPFAGYFYSTCDGKENVYTLDALKDISPSSFDGLKNAQPGTDPAGRTAVGKLSASRKWYLVIETEKDSLDDFPVGRYGEVEFADCGGLVLNMLLERIVEEGERALLIYSSEEMPDRLYQLRRYNVSVKTAEYSGLRVPVSAIRYVDGREGVYALFGNTVLFRVIEVEGTVDGYAYVKENGTPVTVKVDDTDKEGNPVEREVILYGALGLYDSIITSGTGLYHGQIID